MDNTIKDTITEEFNEQESLINEESEASEERASDDALKEAINAQLKKIQRQNMLLGAQTMCSVVLEKIIRAMGRPGKRTLADYKRLVKDIEQFCRTGLSRKINADGEAEIVEEETTETNNTKLMEGANESYTNEDN